MGGTVEVSTEFGSMFQSPCVSMGLLAGFGDVSFTAGTWTLNQRIRVTGVDGLGNAFDETAERDLAMTWFGVDWSHPWLAGDLVDRPGVRWRVDLRSALGAGFVSGSAGAVSTASVPSAAADVDDAAVTVALSAVVKSEVRLGGGWSISTSARYTTGLFGGDTIALDQLVTVDAAVELRW